MRYHERDDRELLELAQAGWAPAFAVLVHRHGPALLTAFADDPDPVDRVTDVFVRAMRQLPERDPGAPVTEWLFALAGRPVPDAVPDLPADTMDPIWRHLTLLWPDGRHVNRQHPVARKVVTIVGAIALGVAVPTIVLGIPAPSADGNAASVRAEPLDDEPVEEVEPEELPTFEFPDVGGDGTQAPADEPTDQVTEPETTPSPTAPVVPTPTPAPTATSTPAPTVDEPATEPTAEPTTEPIVDPEPTTPPPPPADGDGDGAGSGDGGDGGGGGGDADGGASGGDGDVLGLRLSGADRP